MNSAECPFCEMGQAKRMMIWRLTRKRSIGEIRKLLKENLRPQEYKCSKCGKICGNAGLLAMHMKSPARKYRSAHRKFDEGKLLI